MHRFSLRRPALLVVLLLTATSLLACIRSLTSHLSSDLFIEPNKQFVLGGNQQGAYKVVARNVGLVSVEFRERLWAGGNIGRTTLAAGKSGTLNFQAGSAALLLNPSGQQAHLYLRVTGDTQLSMSNEVNGKPDSVAAAAQQLPRLKMSELRGLAQQWERGSLTYLDYTSGRTVTLQTSLNGMQARADELVLDFIYTEPEGQQVKGYDKLRVLPDGHEVVWDGLTMQLVSKTRLPNGNLQLVLTGAGTDNNQPCQLRRTVVLGPRLFSVVKEVRLSGAPEFSVRNTYRFER